MSAMQKHAWYYLAVVTLTACTVLALFPLMGVAAHGGFGLLGLLGFGPLFLRKKKGDVVADERDTLIQRRSVILGYSVLWLVFVGGSCLAPLWYGMDGSVPVVTIVAFPWYATVFFIGVMSVATLVQYNRGA